MAKHFNNHNEALNYLISNGWKKLKNSRFIDRNGICVAQILTAFGEAVSIQVWEI